MAVHRMEIMVARLLEALQVHLLAVSVARHLDLVNQGQEAVAVLELRVTAMVVLELLAMVAREVRAAVADLPTLGADQGLMWGMHLAALNQAVHRDQVPPKGRLEALVHGMGDKTQTARTVQSLVQLSLSEENL